MHEQGEVDAATGAIVDCRNLAGWSDLQHLVSMTTYLNAVPAGRLLLFAVADEAGLIQYGPAQTGCNDPRPDPRVEAAYQALEALGSQQIRQVQYRGAWAMLVRKGEAAPLAEGHANPDYAELVYCVTTLLRSAQVTATTTLTALVPAEWGALPLVVR